MSRTVSRRRRSKRSTQRRQEVLGIIVLLFALVLLLSLVSYSPTDPPAYDTAVDVRNWMGRLGAGLAHGIVWGLGRIPPLLTIVVIFLWGWRLLRHSVDRRLITLSVKILGIQLLLSILLAFPHFLLGEGVSYDLAGELGGSLTGFLVSYTGRVGAPLVWIGLVMLFMIAAFGWRPGEVAGGIARAGRTAGSLVVKLAGALASLFRAVIALGGRILRRPLSVDAARRGRKAAPGGLPPQETATAVEPSVVREREAATAVEPSVVGAEKASLAAVEAVAAEVEEQVRPVQEVVSGEPDLFAGVERGEGEYEPPPLGLFARPSVEEMGPDEATVREEAELLHEKLLSFGVKANVTGWLTGPVITRFEVKPAPGVKVNQIVNLADDLALAMRAKRIRIVAPIPGKAAVGVEIPNPKTRVVHLREVLESDSFSSGQYRLPLAIGKTISGEPFVADLAGMPHLLLAGTTGSGKSVCINGIIASLLYRMGPEQCRFIMVDPKMLEMGIYNAIPHLVTPVVTDPKKAVDALRWAVFEMEERYDRLAAAMVRDVEQYNAKVRQLRKEAEGKGTGEREEDIPDPLPYIIIIVDELADVMMTAMAEIETLIQRLAQKARAVGIHLILATQRPSVDVITGPIKTNFSTRIAFQVPSKTDSRTILDMNGAEKLLGRGDMLFMNPSFPEPLRIHGSFLSNEEIERLVNLVGGQELEIEEMDIFAPAGGDRGGMGAAGEALDSMLRDAANVVVTHEQGSISLIQRRLGVGYTRAARMMDQLEMLGVVGPPDGTKAREVLMREEDLDDLAWGGR